MAQVLLVGVALVAPVAAGELLLRLALPAPIHSRFPQERYVYDTQAGITLAPNQRAFTHDKSVQTNSIGIRDKEYSDRAPAGVLRLVALGDSQTFGNGLAIEDTWPKQLETNLNDRLGSGRWEVLNCGIPGTDTWQHEITLTRMLNAYHPDLAILGFYANDVTARFDVKPDAVATATNTVQKRLAYLLKESVLFLALRDALASLRDQIRPSREFMMEQAIITGVPDRAVEKGWEQVDHSLAVMKSISDTHRVALLVLVIPRRDQVSGRQPARNYQKRIHAILERHGIPYVDVLAAMQQAYARYGRGMFIPWDGHTTAVANRIIAHELTDVVRGMPAVPDVPHD